MQYELIYVVLVVTWASISFFDYPLEVSFFIPEHIGLVPNDALILFSPLPDTKTWFSAGYFP